MRKIIIELLLLFAVSLIIVFFQFNQVPKKLSWDEVEFARLALSLDGKPYTPYSQLATGHSTLYFYILLISIKTFGLNNFALRFPAALFGVVNVLLFYFLARLVFANIRYFKKSFFNQNLPIANISIYSLLPLLTSLIFISLRWYFNFARFSFEATFLLYLELMTILFFFLFQKTRVIIYLIGTAVFSGLVFHSYYPGRIFFLLPLLFLFYYPAKKLVKKNVFIFLLIFLLTAFPLLVYLSTHKDLRIQEQLFLTDKKINIKNKISYFVENIVKVGYMFNLQGDLNGRHNYPGKSLFNPVVGAIFLFGLLVTILNLKIFSNQFFFIYFILSLVPSLFTYPVENPNSLRTYTSIISSVYFIGNGITYLLQSEKRARMLFLVVVLVLILLFALSSMYDLRTYFLYQRQVFNKSFELNGTIQRILNLKLWEKTHSL